MNRAVIPGFVSMILAFFAAGCGPDGPRVVPVSGVVMRKGTPVAHVHLNFMPAAGRPSWGISDEQGKFTLHYDREQDGAEVGMHKVFVRFRAATPKDELDFLSGKKKLHPDQKLIEEKFGKFETTPLQVEVKSSGEPVRVELD